MMKIHIINKVILTVFFVFLSFNNGNAHSGFIQHGADIMEVLGLEYNIKLFSRSKDTKNNNSWVKFISSDMIDNTEFHKKLESIYPGFSIKSPKRHRLLFHWAYDAEPWNDELEEIFKEYCQNKDLNIESNIRILKSRILSEQKRRNKLIINKTQEVFGFEKGGKESRIYTHFFASIAYNIHILGDYTTDNTIITGLVGFDKLVGKIIIELRKLDLDNSKQIIKGITQINNRSIDIQKKADLLLDYLKKETPNFIKIARNGSLKRKIEGQGFRFI